LKKAFTVVVLAAFTTLAACAEQSKKEESAKAACEAAPKQLVAKDIKAGTGVEAKVNTPVLMGYTGWLYDPCAPDHKGTMFDTSTKRVTPLGFIVGTGRVIKGWDEGVVGMKEGGERLLVIPPDKAYGATGAGSGLIPPNATLVFEVTLIRVLVPPTPAAK